MQERNRSIILARKNGKSLKEIAREHGISSTRVGQLARRTQGLPPTLEQLPGTEGLTALTRGLLYRLGYRTAASIVVDVESGRLCFGCAFGMGRRRFDELAAWAEKQR